VTARDSSAEKRRCVVKMNIVSVLSLFTAGKKGSPCHWQIIVLNVMVKAANHIKTHVMMMSYTDVRVLPCMIS